MNNTKIRMIRKGGVAALLSLATLTAGLAVGPAAQAAGSSITITAAPGRTLDGFNVTAYKLGDYAESQPSKDGRTVDSVAVKDVDAKTSAWIRGGLNAAQVTQDANYDQAGNLAKLGETSGSAAKQRLVARTMDEAAAAAKPAPVQGVDGLALKGASQTLTVPSDGLYLLTFANGKSMPIIIGTTVDGKNLTDMAAGLGRATLKAKDTYLDKKIIDHAGKADDNGSVTVGTTRTFTATLQIPVQMTNPTSMTYTDTPTGMEYQAGSLKVSVDGQPVTDLKPLDIQPKGDGFTMNLTPLIGNNWGKAITVTYDSTITATKADNTATVTTSLDGVNVTNTDKVTPTEFGFQIRKTDASNAATLLNGAGFTIQNTTTGRYLTWHPAANPTTERPGTWSEGDANGAGQVLTGDSDGDGRITDKDDANLKGVAQFHGLESGTYLVAEKTVPGGYLQAGASTFKVVIDATGGVTITDANNTTLVSAGQGVVTVRNIKDITQLPLTGGFQTAIIGLGGLLIVAGAAAGGTVVVRRLKAERGEASASAPAAA